MQRCGVQFYKRLMNLCCLLLSTVHPSIHPPTATVQGLLVTDCSDKSEDDLNKHHKKEAKEDKQRTEERKGQVLGRKRRKSQKKIK
ncbi:hypothetical protein Pcinc_033568 [Petrolisthes cinctipes]|uniref:Secreted protein n=1 Tax=Petrolisthes cinctipes TaxID=88211 RepID=A0AAE1JX55_PETCI|nr:hypothetical protein Pcinc_033568 [Petrolisthes cinctipes]